MKTPLPESTTRRATSLSTAIQALQQVPEPFVKLFEHGSMSVEYYQPDQLDHQTPHEQDELYVIISGSGDFELEGERKPFQPQDVLFVPAGAVHRFVDFSDDFSTWVIFYGQKGGEAVGKKSQHWQRDDYQLHDSFPLFDVPYIHQFLTNSYWAKGRSLETIVQSMQHSHCFGLFHADKQIGFARVITDYSTFAYLADVFVAESYRGKRLGKWMVDHIVNAPIFTNCNWLLKTLDAQGLYQQLGFSKAKASPEIMEKSC